MPYQSLKTIGKVLNHRLKSWFGVKPLIRSQQNIDSWFSSPLGQRLLSAEQQTLNQIMPKMYGYHLMQLSVLNNIKLSTQSPVTHHFPLGLDESSGAPAVTSFENLPIDAESIDTAVLHHVLEYSTNPHQLLRETARTIIPNGYIIIVGFNPYSLLSIKKLFGLFFTASAHWRYHSLRWSRLADWLRVLEFEPVNIQHGYYGLPCNRGYRAGFDRLCGKIFPISGTYYVITAHKSVVPMTLIKRPWKKTKPIPTWAKGSAVPRKHAVNRELKK